MHSRLWTIGEHQKLLPLPPPYLPLQSLCAGDWQVHLTEVGSCRSELVEQAGFRD